MFEVTTPVKALVENVIDFGIVCKSNIYIKEECVDEKNCYLFLPARDICTQCDIKESRLFTPYILLK